MGPAQKRDLNSLDIIYYRRGQNGEMPAYITPDLKIAGEFNALFDVVERKEVKHLRVSKSVLAGDTQGIKASAEYDLLNSYMFVYTVQEHYRTMLEHLFWKLGLDDTRFEWVDPLADVGSGTDFQIGVNGLDGAGPVPPFQQPPPPKPGQPPPPKPGLRQKIANIANKLRGGKPANGAQQETQ